MTVQFKTYRGQTLKGKVAAKKKDEILGEYFEIKVDGKSYFRTKKELCFQKN